MAMWRCNHSRKDEQPRRWSTRSPSVLRGGSEPLILTVTAEREATVEECGANGGDVIEFSATYQQVLDAFMHGAGVIFNTAPLVNARVVTMIVVEDPVLTLVLYIYQPDQMVEVPLVADSPDGYLKLIECIAN